MIPFASNNALALLVVLQTGAAAAAPAPIPQCLVTPAPSSGRIDDDHRDYGRASASAASYGGPGQVLIDWPGGSVATLRREGREVLLSSPRALPSIDGQALMDCAAGLLEGVSLGYDTLLLSLAPGVTLSQASAGTGLHLVLQRGPDAALEGPLVADTTAPGAGPLAREDVSSSDARRSRSPAELRLRLLEAQLLAQTGQLSEARTRFEALRQEMPESPEPLAGSANLAQQSGRWRQALALYQTALLLDPGERGLTSAIDAIERTAGRRLRADIEYRETQGSLGTGRATAIIGGLSGQQPFGNGWRLGFNTEFADVDATQVQRRDGTVGSFSGPRERAELFLQYDSRGGQVIIGSLFLTGDTPGAGIRVELPDESGVTALRAEFRRPNWDFFQSIIDRGTRDRVAVGRRQQLTGNLTGRLEVGANRYGIASDREVASTMSVTGELRFGGLAGVRGLSAAYVLDGEYLLRRDERTGPEGQRFAPLQIVDREVHALTLGYARAWGSSAKEGIFTTEFSGGYGVDRYGRAGPLVAGSVGYVLNRFEARLRGSYVENIGRTQGTTTVVGGSLSWFF